MLFGQRRRGWRFAGMRAAWAETEKDYPKLRDLLPEYLRVLFVLGYHTCARLGEFRGIQWSQAAHDRIVLHRGSTKNKEDCWLPISGEMAHWQLRWGSRGIAQSPCITGTTLSRIGIWKV